MNLQNTADLLKSKDNILIFCHISPDGDTIGSAYSLLYALTDMGKTARVICADEIPQKYSYITTKCTDSEFKPQFFVAVDVATCALLGEEYENQHIDLCIDHHPSNELFASKTYLNDKAAANCENMYNIILAMGCKITPVIADCLYTGISTDTGCFKFSNTSYNTHIIAGELFKFGCNYSYINTLLFDTKSKSRMMLESMAFNNIEYYFNQRVALLVLTDEMKEKANATDGDLDGISSIPRSIEGTEIGITMSKRNKVGYKLSVRTTEDYDASLLCSYLNGGGHKRAAGCVIEEEDIAIAKQTILDIVAKIIKK
ncbi:MAG: bifunctional oligoribonuclease/PAP phosphatase NrnA [Oscillospiraceae bacterium]